MALITVTGTFYKPSGSGEPITNYVRFSRVIAPQVVDAVVSSGHDILALPNGSGVISQTLLHGAYKVFPWDDDRYLTIDVEESPSTQDISNIADSTVILTSDLPVRAYTLATLRARTRHEGQQIAMMSYFTTVGDGGAGWFFFVSASTATDDAGLSCVKPTDIDTADPGRWIRLS